MTNMPTPLDILLDPVSLWVISLYACLIALELIFPARKLIKIKGWYLRSLTVFAIYFYLSTYLPLLWDSYLAAYQLFDLSQLSPLLGALIGLMIFEFLIYVWHRTMHQTNWLWHSFHQMHHSAERLDAFGAFYFSPLDMIGFTFVGSLSLALLVGLSPQAVTLFLYGSIFLAIFQHTNIKTPRWLGYIIQRPESHSVHHSKGVHAFNYSDLPLFDIIFGTFKNPEKFAKQTGFYNGASKRIPEMLIFKDVSRPPQKQQTIVEDATE
jgi:sterol desaturase/sphingolipid hydroxylase (fatty acid hydroxylase superfamily)